ncbi:MAG TPA: serine hydroxymethyltransferase [Candidatus Azoamicus sp. OHIO2]
MITKQIKRLILLEQHRQENSINLIASENYMSLDYSKLETSILSTKYAEGYPSKRYYAGCKYIDLIENIAIKTCKKLFNVKYVNVQPHSGSQANQAVYMALCSVYDTILGLNLKHGGHLTHGYSSNFSGHFYHAVGYNLNNNYYIDYDDIEKQVHDIKPKLIIGGASAYSRVINWKILKNIAKKYNAFLLADISHTAGLIATNIYPSPVAYADLITLTLHKTLRGPRGAVILTNNKNLASLVNKAVFPGIQGGPFMNVITAKSLCFKKAMLNDFHQYQKQVIKNAKDLSYFLQTYGFDIVSNGTDSHMFLINLTNLNLTGIESERKLEKANIILNKNTLPNDLTSSNVCGGVRIGTAAVTTRGFGKNEMVLIADWIYCILKKKNNVYKIKKDVINLCKKFPINKKL